MSDLHDDYARHCEPISDTWRRTEAEIKQRVAAYRHTHVPGWREQLSERDRALLAEAKIAAR